MGFILLRTAELALHIIQIGASSLLIKWCYLHVQRSTASYSNKPVLRQAWVLRQTDNSHSPVAPLPPNSLVRCYNTLLGLKRRLLGYRMSPLFFLARTMVNLRANFVRLRHWSRSRTVPVAKFHLKLRILCMHVIVGI